MMEGLFVRGLWGPGPVDTEELRRPWQTSVQAMRATWSIAQLPRKQLVVCFGAANYEVCREEGMQCHLADAHSIVNWELADSSAGPVDWCYWGTSTWRHKIEAIAYAFTLADHVVWMDWDTRQVAPLPPDFWEQRAAGPPFQASLRLYHRRQCKWRTTDKRQVPHGAWLYVRGMEVIDGIREAHRQHCPRCTDEIAAAWWFDHQNGGWIGADEWLKRGHDPGCYDQGRAGKFRVMHPIAPEKIIFRNVGRY